MSEKNLIPAPKKGSSRIVSVVRSLMPNIGWDEIKETWKLFKESPYYPWAVKGAFTLIGTSITSILARWQGLPPDLKGVLIIALVWFLILSIVFVLGRLRGRKPVALPIDEVQPKAQIAETVNAEHARMVEELKERVHELGSENIALEKSRKYASDLYEEARRQIERLKYKEIGLQIGINSRINDLESQKWLVELAKQDKEQIQHMVLVTGCSINFSYLTSIEPHVDFTFTVFNASLYPISFDLNADGYISFNNQKLGGNKELSCLLKIFAHGSRGSISICQFVSDSAAATIARAAEDRTGMFKLDNLTINFSGKDIEQTRLKLPEGVYTTGILYP